MSNEIIVVEQLPVITERLQEIKVDVMARVENILNLACTSDTVKTVKEERAKLNKELKSWEDKRKEVKKAVLNPYEQFETVYKECISDIFKTADTKLKGKIDSVESELKEEKAAEVQAYFDEYLASKNLPIPMNINDCHLNITLSASLKSLKTQVKDTIDRVCDDLNLIETQEHKDEILYEYKQSLNVSSAITTVANRYKAIEEAKAKEEERKAREEAAKQAVQKVETVVETLTPPTVEPLAPPVEEEKILTLRFTVKGTRAKLRALKEFLEKGNYDYE